MKLLEDHFSTKEKRELVDAIEAAENLTSGEIRIYFERSCEEDPFERGKQIFEKLGMHRTQLRNGVLFYISLADHKFAIVADKGINDEVPDGFWQDIRDEMRNRFREISVLDGMKHGIKEAGEQLATYFPVQADDKNELSNELLFHDEEE
jgi:uncharacterized membrane protein